MKNIKEILGGNTPSQRADMARELREIAQKAEDGKISEFTMMFVEEGVYTTRRFCTLSNNIAMSAMLFDDALKRMRKS